MLLPPLVETELAIQCTNGSDVIFLWNYSLLK